MATILVTCVGSGVGQSVIDSLNLRREHKIIGCDGNRGVYAYWFCDTFFIAPSIYSDEYIDFLLDLGIQHSVDLIVPGHDHELLLLSNNIERFNENGIKVVVSKPDLIEISRDKKRWYDFFSKFGCRIVPTYWVKDFKLNPDETLFPVIVKPVGGSASQGITIINNLSELSEAADDNIVQPYLFPERSDKNYETIYNAVKKGSFTQMSEISIQLIFSKDAKFSGIFISKNTLKNGIPVFVDPIDPNGFDHLDEIMRFVPILEEKRVIGPVNIQGRVTESGLYFFEMNMRFTGITGNRAQLGFNEVDYLVNNFLDKQAVLNGYAHNKLGVRQVACAAIPRAETKSRQTCTLLGGGGFIGSSFLSKLIDDNRYQRVNLICRDESYKSYLERFQRDKVYVFRASDPFIETIYCQTDVVVNFASALAYQPEASIYESIIFQYEQVQKLIKANVPLIINVSSQSVYDQSLDIEKDESFDVYYDNTYAFQKVIGERFFRSISTFSPRAKVISLRLSRVVGGSSRKINGFFAKIVDSLLQNNEIQIPFPYNKTNLIDVRDVVLAIDHIISNVDRYDFPEVINVGGTNLTIKEYCDVVIDKLDDPAKSKLLKYGADQTVKTSSMLSSDVMKNSGWLPTYTLEELINNFINSTERKN